jgi:alkanesulfonate monooxygenase SsuD/methylene tetrahydromethanopterin reductase-like flavin-dependent oxidoreductase (luciferase family)
MPSVMPYYDRLRQGYQRSLRRFENADGATRAAQLATLTYEEVLHERVVFGTPKQVTAHLRTLEQALGLSWIIIEPNIGGDIPPNLVAHSMHLFAQEVAPRLRDDA